MIHDVGPIPVGSWTMGEPYDAPESTGFYTIPLTPKPGTETFGRTALKIHGDDVAYAGLQKASDGCVVLARFAREILGTSEDRDFDVVV